MTDQIISIAASVITGIWEILGVIALLFLFAAMVAIVVHLLRGSKMDLHSPPLAPSESLWGELLKGLRWLLEGLLAGHPPKRQWEIPWQWNASEEVFEKYCPHCHQRMVRTKEEQDIVQMLDRNIEMKRSEERVPWITWILLALFIYGLAAGYG